MAVPLSDTEKVIMIFGLAQLQCRHVTVDTEIKSKHTANAILKQSGINYKF